MVEDEVVWVRGGADGMFVDCLTLPGDWSPSVRFEEGVKLKLGWQ